MTKTKTIQKQVKDLLKKAGKCKIIAATKLQSVQAINIAINAGITEIGENRIQEACEKFPHLPKKVKKHFIGHLQTNKVKKAITFFDCIQSIDSLKLAKAVNEEAKKQKKDIEVMIQINISGEKQKEGILPEQLAEVYDYLLGCRHLIVKGIMCVPKETNMKKEKEKDELKKIFQKMKELQKDFKLQECSMGMSDDYSLAIGEGSTMIRVGKAIFGDRK